MQGGIVPKFNNFLEKPRPEPDFRLILPSLRQNRRAIEPAYSPLMLTRACRARRANCTYSRDSEVDFSMVPSPDGSRKFGLKASLRTRKIGSRAIRPGPSPRSRAVSTRQCTFADRHSLTRCRGIFVTFGRNSSIRSVQRAEAIPRATGMQMRKAARGPPESP